MSLVATFRYDEGWEQGASRELGANYNFGSFYDFSLSNQFLDVVTPLNGGSKSIEGEANQVLTSYGDSFPGTTAFVFDENIRWSYNIPDYSSLMQHFDAYSEWTSSRPLVVFVDTDTRNIYQFELADVNLPPFLPDYIPSIKGTQVVPFQSASELNDAINTYVDAMSDWVQNVSRNDILVTKLHIFEYQKNMWPKWSTVSVEFNEPVTLGEVRSSLHEMDADFLGTEFDDKIVTGLGVDWLFGYGGNDELLAGEGDDVILAGDGNDILDGEAGLDELYGGNGNDTYLLHSADWVDFVVEAENAGTDLVRTIYSYTLSANVENGLLEGSSNLYLVGNELSNSLIGNGGSNILNGRGGADRMFGYGGNDTYIIDSTSDIVGEI
ncbi:calcium-binding protein, partial [Roseibium sp. FZY0029]|nr:calcium-binding protein [Roseibium sp. FZY0029]